MATPPTFVSGQVLTAAQMNTIGLHLVKTQTVGSAQTSVPVTGAFSADYDAYRIIWSGGTVSTSAAVGFQLKIGGGAISTTSYYGGLSAASYAAGAFTGGADSNASQFTWAGGGDAGTFGLVDLQVIDPYKTSYTKVSGPAIAGSYAGHYAGVHALNTSYTDFVLDPFGTATMSGGTIRVYGYRNS